MVAKHPRAMLVTFVGLAALAFLGVDRATDLLEESERSTAQKMSIRIHLDESEKGETAPQVDLVERAESRVLKLQEELQRALGEGDPEILQGIIGEARPALNVVLAQAVAFQRIEWLLWLEHGLKWATFAALLLLLVPWWRARREEKSVEARAGQRILVPYYVVATLALFVLSHFFLDTMLHMQVFQVELACFGSPAVALSDALLHTIQMADLERAVQLIEMFIQGLGQEELGAGGLLELLGRGASVYARSEALGFTVQLVGSIGFVLVFYGPILAIAVFYVLIAIGRPLLVSTISYPDRVASGEVSPRIRDFLKEQFGLLWAIFKAGLWIALAILLLTLVSIVVLRALGFVIVYVMTDFLLEAIAIAAVGESVPEAAIIIAGASLGILLLVAVAGLAGAVAVLLGKAWRVIWDKTQGRRKFRDYPEFGRLTKDLLVKVFGGTTLCCALGMGAFLALDSLVALPIATFWLAALTLGPVTVLCFWRFRLWRTLRDAMGRDPILSRQLKEPI